MTEVPGQEAAGGLIRDRADLNLAQRFERIPLSRHQNKLFLIIATAWLFDSIDLAALTFVLAPISNEFSLSATQAGFLASASFAGMAVGATGAGVLADRFGRRPVFTVSMIFWGVASLLMAFSWNLPSLVAFRFLIGVGMGAEFPVAQALLSEFVPSKHRGKYIGWLEGFWPLGFVAAGGLALLLVPSLGWRSFFVVEFILALYAFYIRRAVPESPRWHESRGALAKADSEMRAFETKVEAALGRPLPEPSKVAVIETPSKHRFPVLQLFTPAFRRRTIMVWGMWFCALLGYYAITSWMGKLLADSGMTITGSIAFVLLMTLWGIPGFLLASYLLDRLGRRPVVVGAMLLSAVMAYFYGNASSVVELIAFGSPMQFFLFAMWSAMYSYTPEVFSTHARATGCGTASTLGRIGALIGPSLVPIILVAWGQAAVFAVCAVFFVLAAGVVLVLGPETRHKVLEELSG